MQITLTQPELERFIAEQVEAGHYASPQALVEAAVSRLMLDLQTTDLDEETLAAIDEGNAQIERGEGIAFDQFPAQMRENFTAMK